ncbi:MAG: hypothetical protein ACLVCW_08330, partial [Campylobacter sp.]
CVGAIPPNMPFSSRFRHKISVLSFSHVIFLLCACTGRKFYKFTSCGWVLNLARAKLYHEPPNLSLFARLISRAAAARGKISSKQG